LFNAEIKLLQEISLYQQPGCGCGNYQLFSTPEVMCGCHFAKQMLLYKERRATGRSGVCTMYCRMKGPTAVQATKSSHELFTQGNDDKHRASPQKRICTLEKTTDCETTRFRLVESQSPFKNAPISEAPIGQLNYDQRLAKLRSPITKRRNHCSHRKAPARSSRRSFWTQAGPFATQGSAGNILHHTTERWTRRNPSQQSHSHVT